MRQGYAVGAAVLALCLAACGRDSAEATAPAAAAEPQALGVELTVEEREKLGIEVGEIAAAQVEPTVDAPARVVDAPTVIETMAALDEAETRARTSHTALERARSLFAQDTAVSADVLEAAERQAAQDDAALRSARARATLSFGASAPWLDAARRERVLANLTRGSTLLVSASFASGFGTELPRELGLRRLAAADSERWVAREVWLAPADPSLPGPTLLALVEAPRGLSVGERLIASVAAGDRLAGVVVPRSAVVLAGGEAWCYVQTGDEAFTRRRVILDRPVEQGYLQVAGFAADETVVVAGAGLLLAREVGGGAEEEE